LIALIFQKNKSSPFVLAVGLALGSLLFSPWAAAQSTIQSPTQTAQAAPSLSEKSLAELQRRVNDGQFGLAYDMAKSMPDAQGDPHFDFLFGVAAVNVGRSAEAVLALQRHLALVPGNDRARLDLARAYFDLGDYVRARQEFEFVLRYNPPAEVRSNITRYLDSMQTRESLGSRANVRFYAEVGYGQDTNTNLGTYNDTLNSAIAFGTQIDPTSKGQFSNFAWLAAGGRWVRQVNAPFSVFAGVDMDNKLNQDTPQFNTTNATAYSGFSLVSGPILYRLALSDAITNVNNFRYSGRLATSGEMQYFAGGGLTLIGRLQYAEQSYSSDISYRDSTVETAGFGVENAFASAWRPTVGFQLSEAKEDNLANHFDLSRVLDTWRISTSVSPTDKIGLLFAYSEQQVAYQAISPGFDSVRSDVLATLDLILSYSLDPNWTLRADIQQMDNKSNQSLYAFRRTMGGLKLRYSF
jgi:tetratricopeptide (TPR) repeat protein